MSHKTYRSSFRSRSPGSFHSESRSPTKICHFYQQDHCKYGSRCKYSHNGPSRGVCSRDCKLCPHASRRSNPRERGSRSRSPVSSINSRRARSRSPEDERRRCRVSRSRSSTPDIIRTHRELNRRTSESHSPERNGSSESLSENPVPSQETQERSRILNSLSITFSLIELMHNIVEREVSEPIRPQREPELVLEEESDPAKACAVCLTYKRDRAFIPCGHKALCGKCASNQEKLDGNCVMCRKPFEKILQIFE